MATLWETMRASAWTLSTTQASLQEEEFRLEHKRTKKHPCFFGFGNRFVRLTLAEYLRITRTRGIEWSFFVKGFRAPALGYCFSARFPRGQ